MKTISKLKLNVLSEENLLEREMNALKGGNDCSCSCYYTGSGGSTSASNRNENYISGYTSPVGCNQYLLYDYGSAYCDTCKEN
ncbi:MAG: TIGR04149 family rSAM-modified RiPP [Fermentimonas sp.]|jgi:natural product precursor|nr:TIGR04149 family rSAM-modified RiPP [Fermentimonas sp.]